MIFEIRNFCQININQYAFEIYVVVVGQVYNCLLSSVSVSHCTRTWPFGASMSRFNRQSQKPLSTLRTARNSPFFYRIGDSVSSRFSLSFCSPGNEILLRFVSLAGALLAVSPNGDRCPYISGCACVAARTGPAAEANGVLAVWIPSRMLRSFFRYVLVISLCVLESLLNFCVVRCLEGSFHIRKTFSLFPVSPPSRPSSSGFGIRVLPVIWVLC